MKTPGQRAETRSRMRLVLLSASLAMLTLPLSLFAHSTALADKTDEKPYPISSALPANVQAFLHLETGATIFNLEHRYAKKAPGAPDGAYLQNVGSSRRSWYIEDQRYGDGAVIGGILHQNTPLLRAGLRMFDFGLDREARNGSFPGSYGLFHGTAMFLAAAGPAMLLLKYWNLTASLGPKFAAHMRWEDSRMHDAAHYLIHKWWSHPGHIDDGSKEERFFEGAIALESVGVLAGDRSMERDAAVYALEGLRMTRSNGVMPENGGHDSSYQAIGLIYATRYLMLATGSSVFRSLEHTISQGERWEYSRTRSNGTINRRGDDRTGPNCPERDNSGKCKTVDLIAIAGALGRWGVVSHDSLYIRRAYLVWLQNMLQVTHSRLPAPGLFVKPDPVRLAQLRQGQWVLVSGTRFQPLEPVRVYLDSTLEGETTCDMSGNFGGHSPVWNVRLKISASIKPGRYRVVGRGAYGTRRATTLVVKE